MTLKYGAAVILLLAILKPITLSQEDPVTERLVPLAYYSTIHHNLVYATANRVDLTLDVTVPYEWRDRSENRPLTLRPTLIYIHGGGWIRLSKEEESLRVLPFLTQGMAVVNVDYRLAKDSLAPAAVEDCRCALRWVYRHSKEYGFDLSKIVVFGSSAGGHLSLMTGMLHTSDGFDRECPGEPGEPEPRVAAIVEIAGITDVGDLLAGPNQRSFAVRWFGNQPTPAQLSKQVSPISYVRSGPPPILIIHGDADDVVPFRQAVVFHEALDREGATNQLLALSSTRHGYFNEAQLTQIYSTIYSFLGQHGILKVDPSASVK